MRIGRNSLKTGVVSFFETDKPLYILLALAFLERLLAAYPGMEIRLIVSDSINYYEAGIEFAKTGALTYGGYTSALIMPGITVVVGALAALFGEGEALLRALEFVWAAMGSLTLVFVYKSVKIFTNRFCALLAASVYLLPHLAVIDNYLLTEGPYYLFFAMALYYMLMMGESMERRYVWRFGFSALGALMFRANIMMLLVLALVYLIILKKYSLKELLKRALLICGIFAIFIVPWTIRNYYHFHDFIPVTYGVGNPVFEGSFQGELCPEYVEDQMDYTALERDHAEKYADFYDENGELRSRDTEQYLNHMYLKALGEYRIKTWFKTDPANFLKTYFLIKPRIILNWVWYWEKFLGIGYETIRALRQLNFLFCGFTLALAFILKKYRKLLCFLTAAYFVNIIMVAYALAIDRYAQMAMLFRYVIAGIGLYLLYEAVLRLKKPRAGKICGAE